MIVFSAPETLWMTSLLLSVTIDRYVPLATKMVSPEPASVTAAWMLFLAVAQVSPPPLSSGRAASTYQRVPCAIMGNIKTHTDITITTFFPIVHITCWLEHKRISNSHILIKLTNNIFAYNRQTLLA